MICVDHYFSSHPELLNNVEWFTGDVTDIFSLEEALEGVTHVYHCAARVSFQPNDKDLMHQVNKPLTARIRSEITVARLQRAP